MIYENTLAIIKPDGVKRNLADTIIKLFEENSFEVVCTHAAVPTYDFITKQLSYDAGYTRQIGKKVSGLFDLKHMDIGKSVFASKNDEEIGLIVKEWMKAHLISGVNMAMIIKGVDAIAGVKEMCGSTFPADADKQSIRGKYGSDSFEICIQEGRAPDNIIHAAESKQEADYQIKLWFPDFKI